MTRSSPFTGDDSPEHGRTTWGVVWDLMSSRSRLRVAALGCAATMLLASCADGGEDRPSFEPTRSLSQQPSRTVSIPSPSGLPSRSDSSAEPEPEPEPSDSEEPSEPASQSPTEIRSETPSETPSQSPSETPTASPTESAPPSATAEASPTPSPESADGETSTDEDGVPAGVWWLVAAVVAGLAIGVPLVLRSRRRKTWQANYATARAEAAWLTRELVPELRRSGSREQVAGGWGVSSARVRALEDSLTALEATSPDEPPGAQARALRDAVRAARVRIEALVAPGSGLSTSAELAGVSTDLELALRQAGPSPTEPDV